MNVADAIARHARARPSDIAVIEGNLTLDYAALERAVARMAAWFREQGVLGGEVVCVALPSGTFHLVVIYALARLGAVQVALSRQDSLPLQQGLAALTRASGIVTADGDSRLPGLRAIIPPRRLLHDAGAPSDAIAPPQDGDRPWRFKMSSGTTNAMPKAFIETHAMEAALRRRTLAILHGMPGDRYLSVFDISLTYGRDMCLQFLFCGSTIVFPPPDERSHDLCALIDRYDIAFTVVVPSLVEAMLASPGGRGVRLPRIKTLGVGAGALRQALREQIVARLTPNAQVFYGTNEMAVLTAGWIRDLIATPGAVGRPCGGVEVEIVDDQGKAVPPGETGLIRARVGDMPDGYVGDAQRTATAFRNGWYYPGDAGHWSPEGLLVLAGRADDLMIYDGIKIVPADIEEVLLSHPLVAEAAAFAMPSKRHQDVPAAAVTVRGPADGAALLAFAQRRLGTRAPRMVMIVTALPKNPMGKVLKRELVRLFRAVRPKLRK